MPSETYPTRPPGAIDAYQVERFWSRYTARLDGAGVKPTVRRWYRAHAEAFIEAMRPRRLAELSAQDVDAYLRKVDRAGRAADWQFRQIVDALWNLAAMAGVLWIDSVDWGRWRDSAQQLAANHSTVARDYTPGPRLRSPGPVDGGSGDDRDGESSAATPEGTFPGPHPDAVRRAQAPLFDRLVTEIRARGYSIRTERSYSDWVARFLAFHGGAQAATLADADVGRFLDWLAVERRVSASTQNQALNGVLFLFRHVLGREEIAFGDFARAKRPKRLPTVLTKGEVARLLAAMEGSARLMASLSYGGGLRLMEVLRLRVQDLDFGYCTRTASRRP